MKFKISKLNLVLSFLLIALFIILCALSWSWADDFGVQNNFDQQGGIFKMMIHGYFHWDGRYADPLTIIQLILINLQYPPLAICIWGCFYVINLYLIIRLIGLQKISFTDKILFGGFIFYGMRETLSQTLFWVTGGIYTGMLTLFLIWVTSMKRKYTEEKNQLDSKSNYALIFLTFLIGMNGPQFFMSAMGFIFFLLFFEKNKLDTWKLIAKAVAMFFSALIIILAPGNKYRIVTTNPNRYPNTWFDLCRNFYDVLYTYLLANRFLFICAVLLAFYFHWSKKNADAINLKFSFSFIWIGLGSIAPFVIYPDFASFRTSEIFGISIFIFIFTLTTEILKKFIPSPKGTSLTPLIHALSLVFICLVLFTWNYRSLRIFREINKDYAFLERQRNSSKPVVLEKRNWNPPKIKEFNDLTDDTASYINHDMSIFYGIKSIRRKTD